MARSLTDLPVELIQQIFHHLVVSYTMEHSSKADTRDAQASMASLSRTSRTMANIAQWFLYRDVLLTDARSTWQFWRTIVEHPSIRQSVYALKLCNCFLVEDDEEWVMGGMKMAGNAQLRWIIGLDGSTRILNRDIGDMAQMQMSYFLGQTSTELWESGISLADQFLGAQILTTLICSLPRLKLLMLPTYSMMESHSYMQDYLQLIQNSPHQDGLILPHLQTLWIHSEAYLAIGRKVEWYDPGIYIDAKDFMFWNSHTHLIVDNTPSYDAMYNTQLTMATYYNAGQCWQLAELLHESANLEELRVRVCPLAATRFDHSDCSDYKSNSRPISMARGAGVGTDPRCSALRRIGFQYGDAKTLTNYYDWFPDDFPGVLDSFTTMTMEITRSCWSAKLRTQRRRRSQAAVSSSSSSSSSSGYTDILAAATRSPTPSFIDRPPSMKLPACIEDLRLIDRCIRCHSPNGPHTGCKLSHKRHHRNFDAQEPLLKAIALESATYTPSLRRVEFLTWPGTTDEAKSRLDGVASTFASCGIEFVLSSW